ncbi:MAG: ABC transporter ATP-binding protein [Elusimicrobiota bacterium]|nr:ABC transporter ATP-binding protein [Elusimicrobiota bacterium]
MNALSFRNVTKVFGGRRVLDGASGSAEKGKVIGLLGRNGEGKTTLFKILLDLLAADSDEVEVLGLRPDGSGRIRQAAGYIPERPSFHSFMSVAEVLELRSSLYHRWDAARAAGLCKRLGLDPATRLEGASKGTLGKLAWVCAAAHDPALYLLDEPTSGLDALVREEVLSGLVNELGEAGKTVLVSSHRMDELAGLLDEVWVMAGGRIVAVHALDALRADACVVGGRLRSADAPPAVPGAIALGGEGLVRSWAVLDRAARERLLGCGALLSPSVEPLPLDRAFSHLLSLKGDELR